MSEQTKELPLHSVRNDPLHPLRTDLRGYMLDYSPNVVRLMAENAAVKSDTNMVALQAVVGICTYAAREMLSMLSDDDRGICIATSRANDHADGETLRALLNDVESELGTVESSLVAIVLAGSAIFDNKLPPGVARKVALDAVLTLAYEVEDKMGAVLRRMSMEPQDELGTISDTAA